MDHLGHLFAMVHDWRERGKIPAQPIRIPRDIFEDVLDRVNLSRTQQASHGVTCEEIIVWGICFAPEV